MLDKISTDMLVRVAVTCVLCRSNATVKDDHLIPFPQSISFPFLVVRK